MKRLLPCLLALVLLIGCQGQGQNAGSNGKNALESLNQDGAPYTQEFPKAPEKVVAVYQSSIENLLALGLGDKIVLAAALDTPVKDEYKEEFEKIGKYQDQAPSKEEVMALEPDAIVSWSSYFGDKTLGPVDFWNERKVGTYICLNSGAAKEDTLQNEYDDILNLGKMFHVEDKAEAIVKEMTDTLTSIEQQVKDRPKVKTLILEANGDGTFRVYGPDTIGGEIATTAGADLMDVQGKIGTEDIIRLDPDVIFTVYYGTGIAKDEAFQRFLDDESLSNLISRDDKRIYAVNLSEVYASGVRTIDGIRTIAKGIYPDITLAP